MRSPLLWSVLCAALSACGGSSVHSTVGDASASSDLGTSVVDSASSADGGTVDAAPPAVLTHFWGVNIHSSSGATDYSPTAAPFEQEFQVLAARGLRNVRTNVALGDANSVSKLQQLAELGRKYDIRINPVFDSYDTDQAQALSDETYAFVKQFTGYTDVLTDWEIRNEPDLSCCLNTNAGRLGMTKDDFVANVNASTLAYWSAQLKAVSDGIGRVNTECGNCFRRAMNTTQTHFGLIDYMRDYGVGFEVVTYHNYDNDDFTNYWPGSQPLINIWTSLGAYGLPVKLNEFACNQIPSPNDDWSDSYYEQNASTMPDLTKDALLEACVSALSARLASVAQYQTTAHLEEVNIYELLNEPNAGSSTPSEHHYGLMYDLAHPKLLLYVAAAYAGGALSSDERNELVSQGVFTSAQIDQLAADANNH